MKNMEVLAIAKQSNEVLINEQITLPEDMVIGPNGEKIGIKSISDAQTLAKYAGLDLVLLNSDPKNPVCKIIDYNKYRYEKQKARDRPHGMYQMLLLSGVLPQGCNEGKKNTCCTIA